MCLYVALRFLGCGIKFNEFFLCCAALAILAHNFKCRLNICDAKRVTKIGQLYDITIEAIHMLYREAICYV